MIQYVGVWFEIQTIPNVFQDGLDCVRAIYDEFGPNQISVLNTGVFQNGELSNINGTGRQPRPDTEPGHLIVSFPGREYLI
jgi:lipocalin